MLLNRPHTITTLPATWRGAGTSPQLRSSTISTLLAIMSPRLAPECPLLFLLVALLLVTETSSNRPEVEALFAFHESVIDPSGALQSWDIWDLGNAGLSGALVPELGLLPNLQYLELSMNNLSGPIPEELGNLAALVSLDLYENNLTGPIPDSLGQLSNLRFLRLNNNSLNGPIPASLTAIEGLQALDLSHNNLSGEVPTNGSFSLLTPIGFVGNSLLCGSLVGKQCPGQPPFPLPAPNTQASPHETQEPKNRKVIILASTISAAVLMFAIAGFTFIICRSQKHSGHLHKGTKVANVEAQNV